MAITKAMCTSFKGELLGGIHNFNQGLVAVRQPPQAPETHSRSHFIHQVLLWRHQQPRIRQPMRFLERTTVREGIH